MIYVDSSAVVKLVVAEPESAALRRVLDDQQLVSSALVVVEVTRAAARAGLPPDTGAVQAALDVLTLLELDLDLLRGAARLAPASSRSLDAVHLAAAAQLVPDLDAFVAYDRRLLDAAHTAGLPVLSPG